LLEMGLVGNANSTNPCHTGGNGVRTQTRFGWFKLARIPTGFAPSHNIGD